MIVSRLRKFDVRLIAMAVLFNLPEYHVYSYSTTKSHRSFGSMIGTNLSDIWHSVSVDGSYNGTPYRN